MTQIDFTYEEGTANYPHILKTNASGTPVSILFSGLDAEIVCVNGVDLEISKDQHKGIGLDFGVGLVPNWLPLATVIQQGNAQIEDIVREGDIESRNWDRHVQSFSHPSL